MIFTLIAGKFLTLTDAYRVSLYDADCVYRTVILEQEVVR